MTYHYYGSTEAPYSLQLTFNKFIYDLEFSMYFGGLYGLYML